MKPPALLLLAALLLSAQTPDPAHDPLEKGYQALRSGQYEPALEAFLRALELAPRRASIRKELGYVYLKLGEPGLARKAFEQALEIDPADSHTALQLAFAYEQAGDPARAVELFEQVARAGGDLSETAKKALGFVRRPQGTAASDSASETLPRAYEAMGRKDYEAAIDLFRRAVEASPRQTSIRKELAYAYLKIGETEWARDAFEQAYALDPSDHRAGLELAFLRYETGQRGESLASFRKLREVDEADVRLTAEQTTDRVETELRQAMSRWAEAVALDPDNESAQSELAKLYEDFGDAAKAAQHYEAAWRIQPPRREDLLAALAHARQKAGDTAGATAAWLLASYSEDTRIAETARQKLPGRFPYATEFRLALELDPHNTRIRRELAYLFLQVGQRESARLQFERILEDDPDDLLVAAQLAFLYLERRNAAAAVELLERARQSTDEDVARRAREALERIRQAQARPHRELGEKSLQASYLRDAQKAFLRAFEANPDDYSAALKLGVIHNLLRQDREAIRWFKIASQSPDPAVAAQAAQSFRNLAPQFRRVTTTLWTYPFFSTRYHDLFNYAQLKTEFRLGRLPVLPYLSLRFIGDLKQRTGGRRPEFLSESSLIAGLGLRTPAYQGFTLWGEAGEAISYLGDRPPNVPRAIPDYRGGVNWFRSYGATLGEGEPGPFIEANADGVFISRFDNNWIGYWQLRPGYRLPDRGRLKAQLFWNFNITADRNRAYWANFIEFGPGLRLRVPGVSPPMDLTVHLLRGVHLVNDFNPRRPNYYDVRVALWYSFAR